MARVTNASSKALDDALARMIAAAPAGITINSEVRDAKRQKQLWDAAVKKYGSEAEARKWVAPPGHSQHQLGHAADLVFATPAARQWAHANAARFGLVFPLSNEPWHVEVVGARKATTAVPTSAAAMTDQQIRDYVISHYGYAASYLHDKEIGPILLDAAKRGLGGDELRGKLMNTGWWKRTSDAQVAWDYKNEVNPGEAKAAVAGTMSQIGRVAQDKGILLSQKQIHDLSVLYLRNGWNDDQLNNAMHYHAKMDPTKTAPTTSALKQTAADYMVQLSPQTLQQWTDQIMAGKTTKDAFDAYVKDQAKRERPWAAKQIDDGQTTRQIVDPYRQMIGSLLNVDPNAVDFSLPKYAAVLDGQQDKTTGAHGPMSLSQAGQYLRGLPDYTKTPGAIDQAATFAVSLASDFGKMKV